ncbi:hypothetical protein BGLA2_630041 [Burkholderia gladioli]|nr:hypothetical protein BGLA2_630041 [Burkholderia gladioli]
MCLRGRDARAGRQGNESVGEVRHVTGISVDSHISVVTEI